MISFLVVLTTLVCIILMTIILIQNPKGGGIDSALGGSGATQMFGAAKSADFVEKLTWGLAAAVFVLCIITAIIVTGSDAGAAGEIPLQSQQ